AMNFPVVIILLLLVAALLRVDVIFYILYVGVALYAFSYFYTPRVLRRVRVSREFTSRAFHGEPVLVTVRVVNEHWLAVPWLMVRESLAPELMDGERLHEVVSLAAKNTAVFTYHVRSVRRGYYQLGPLFLTTGDLFGFVPEQRAAIEPNYLTVYPRIVTLTQLGLPSRLPFGTLASHQRLFDDPARPFGVREYQSGDSPRQINWKVSGHTQQLMVKTYQPAISLETAVVINLYSPDYDQLAFRSNVVEWGIEVAASLAAHLIDQRQAVGLLTNGRDVLVDAQLHGENGNTPDAFDERSGRLLPRAQSGSAASTRAALPAIPPRNGRAHLMKILERLARLEPADGAAFVDWLPTAVASLTWGTTLLIITPHGDETTYRALHQLVRRGLNPVLLLITPQADWPQRRAQARQLGFVAYNVSALRDLDAWRR
ncbi:MAG: DUF58 domain-containing protein, partial [Anaerolineales bacterium]|nr:DUF58 domain-containing protein [Anaerolineales bacterium]